MTENTFVSLGINLGKQQYVDPRLTLSAGNVAGVVQHLNDLNEIDEVEGVSPIGEILNHIQTINSAVLVSNGLNGDTPPVSPDGGFTPGGYTAPTSWRDEVRTCGPNGSHGQMIARDGVTKAGPKAGQPYKGFFCPRPRGTDQCKPEFVN